MQGETRRKWKVTNVIRLEPGGSSAVAAAKLGIEQPKEMAAHLSKIGDPPSYFWCLGVRVEEEAYAKETLISSTS